MPTRRQFLGSALGGAAALGLGGPAAKILSAATPTTSPSRPTDRPNILFIAIDDLNDWIGCMGGHPDAKTPNLDALAESGVMFSNAHCPGPVCVPSRASLFTGMLPSTSGVYVNGQDWRQIVPEALVLPRHFKDNGYRVLGRGKMIHYEEPSAWHEYDRGPSVVQPMEKLQAGDTKIKWGAQDCEDGETRDGANARWCARRLGEHHDAPFFLALGIFKPHLPFYAPKPYFDMFDPEAISLPVIKENDVDDLPRYGKIMADGAEHRAIVESGKWREAVAAYLAAVAFIDAQIGVVLDALRASPYADNTIVCLWGDHGWHHGQKSKWKKGALWHQTTRTPLMFAGPGISTGECIRPSSLVDIYPTLCDLAGLDKPEALEGLSMTPQLSDPSAPRERPALITCDYYNHALQDERWRYIRYYDGGEELYDHETDPYEWDNLADDPQHAHVIEGFQKWLPEKNVDPGVFDKKSKQPRHDQKMERVKKEMVPYT